MGKEIGKGMLSERLGTLLKREVTGGERRLLAAGDEVLQKLDQESREILEQYLKVGLKREADLQEAAYLGGFRDCLKLFKWLCSMMEKEE